mmetsp:Transcript_10436/g.17011  ORF Transcript_10436/g.17011 Transcript_10436/m.17011 type:complete len:322 (+) Transcript_10436:819-1784(+)
MVQQYMDMDDARRLMNRNQGCKLPADPGRCDDHSTMVEGTDGTCGEGHENEEMERVFAFALEELRREEASELDVPEGMVAYLAASFGEYMEELENNYPTTIEAWEEQVAGWFQECDEDMLERLEGTCAMQIIVESLCMMSLPNSDSTVFSQGDHVLAVLSVDKEWHSGIIHQTPENPEKDTIRTYMVRFKEWGHIEPVAEEDIVLENIEKEEDPSECKVCNRVVPLTFHHLIPREMHNRMITLHRKSKLPSSLENTFQNDTKRSFRDFLNTYGITVCRKCHSQIHRVESNTSLALEFNTLEKIAGHPAIVKWKRFAQKMRS